MENVCVVMVVMVVACVCGVCVQNSVHKHCPGFRIAVQLFQEEEGVKAYRAECTWQTPKRVGA